VVSRFPRRDLLTAHCGSLVIRGEMLVTERTQVSLMVVKDRRRVVAREDDDEAILNHALIQSRRRYRA
jgi:hypothetical protein